jgi:hypothetical protein
VYKRACGYACHKISVKLVFTFKAKTNRFIKVLTIAFFYFTNLEGQKHFVAFALNLSWCHILAINSSFQHSEKSPISAMIISGTKIRRN